MLLHDKYIFFQSWVCVLRPRARVHHHRALADPQPPPQGARRVPLLHEPRRPQYHAWMSWEHYGRGPLRPLRPHGTLGSPAFPRRRGEPSISFQLFFYTFYIIRDNISSFFIRFQIQRVFLLFQDFLLFSDFNLKYNDHIFSFLC